MGCQKQATSNQKPVIFAVFKFLLSMKFDRNTVIGFVVLAALFFGYFYYNNQEQASFQKQKAEEQRIKDSIDAAKAP